MTQPSRWSIARLVRLATVFGAVVLFGASHLAAQETAGKIEGTVRDQQGAPIAGATVLIVGSAYTSTSNEQGYYFINNVPAGVMTVRAQYIGYAPSEVRNVRVLAGQTMTVNVALEQRAVQVGEINVTVEANPIVPRDQVSSKPIVAGDVIQSLPADNVQQVLRLQPGVVESARGLSIRGGRIGEAIIYVDGVPVRSVSGRSGVGNNLVGTNSLEEASITTGAIGAAQGDAQSGVISFVTRSGGEHYTGALSLSSDEIGGQTYGSGTNRLEASLGGPLASHLKFFVSTVMQGQRSAILGKGANNTPLYVLAGVDTTVTVPNNFGSVTSDSTRVAIPKFTQYSNGMRRPDNWNDAWNLDGKLTYTYGRGSRISASYHRTINQGLNFPGTAGVLDSQQQTGFLNTQNIGVINFTQDLSRSAERAFNIDGAFSYQAERNTGGLVDQTWLASHRSPSLGFEFGNMPFIINMKNFPLDDQLITNIRLNNCSQGRDGNPAIGGCIPYLNRSNDFATASSFRFNPYGLTSTTFAATGTGGTGPNLVKENRITGHLAADWQANRFNRVQFGGDFVRSDVFTFASNLTSQIFMDAAHYKPNRMGLYAQDRLDLGDVVIDFGLRYDRLNSNVMFPAVAGRIFSDPLRGGTAGLNKVLTGLRAAIKDPNSGISPADTAALIAYDSMVANRCQADITAHDSLSLSTCNLFPASAHHSLAPSVRVSFPVTDHTGFRLSYAQQTQTPEFQRYASSVNTDLAITNTNSVWGQDIGYGKTILFEFGVRHAFSSDMVLDVAAYNKDKVSDVAGRVLPYFDYFYGTTQAIDLYTNQDFGNVRGIDVKVDRRVGSLFQGSLSYTFQSSKSTGSDPTEYLNSYARQISAVTGDREPAPQAILTTADNRTHTIAGDLVLNLPHGWHQGTTAGKIFGGFGAFATFRFASGLAYTPFFNTGAGVVGPGNGFGLTGNPSAPLNSATSPWIKNVDLRLTRDFSVAHGRSVTVFADFRNLFNWTNIVGLFVETGDVQNQLFQDKSVGPSSSQQQILRTEAGSSYVTKNIGGVATPGIDLSNCSAFAAGSSTANVADCVILRRTEARFADANDPGGANLFFSQSEIDRAYTAYYNRISGPQTFYGPGLNIRLGFDFNF